MPADTLAPDSRTSRPLVSSALPWAPPSGLHVAGSVRPGFEGVRDAFVDNFRLRNELGGACCVFRRGEKVVDLWGGVRDPATGAPWNEDTMVLVFSTTKGLAAMTLAIAHSRGWLDWDERVSTYWPEFAQNGKDAITVRQLLAHHAGLYALDVAPTAALVRDPDALAAVLARQEPAWPPGERQAYHAITLGFYESEILRRVDPRHRTLGRFFDDEIAAPLGLDLYLRLPASIPAARLAPLARPTLLERLRGFPLPFALATLSPRAKIVRALRGSELPEAAAMPGEVYARDLEIPSGGGVGTARAIARAYGAFASGGWELHLRQETLDALAAPAIPSRHGFCDECMHGEMRYSLGFAKPGAMWAFGSPSAFGFPGAGGSFGFADPETGIGYAYVTNRMGTALAGDPRELALRHAVETALAREALEA